MVKFGDVYSLGIGDNETIDFQVIETKGSEAILEAMDYGCPYFRRDINFLSSLKKRNRKPEIERPEYTKFNKVP